MERKFHALAGKHSEISAEISFIVSWPQIALLELSAERQNSAYRLMQGCNKLLHLEACGLHLKTESHRNRSVTRRNSGGQ